MSFFKFSKIFVFIFIAVIFLTRCKENTNNDKIPNVYVNFYIDLSQPDFATLNSVGNSIYVTGGVKGIIIHRATFDDFLAFERVSPYKPENLCMVKIDSTIIFAVDPCSLSKFSLLDGSVVKGPAVAPLKRYQTIFDGNSSLHIFN